MSNVGRDVLVKFGKISISSYSIVRYHKLYSTRLAQTDQLACPSLVSRSCIPCYLRTLSIQKRLLSEQAGTAPSPDDTQKEDAKHGKGPEEYSSSSSSSSSHYRKYYRQCYERRRNHYDNNDHGQSKSSRTEANDITGSHYQRLNIQLDADLDAIKSAYYSLSKIYHPDKVGSDNKQATENFRLITESYQILSDPKLKADYDSQLKGDPNDIIVDATDFGRRPGRPKNDFNVVYRMRDTEMFFRVKQEASLRREKILNPRKFRAGSFTKSDDDPEDQIARLEERIKRLHSFRSNQRDKHHGDSDFYRQHLLNSIHRQREDLQLHAIIHKFQYTDDAGKSDTLSVLVALGALPLFVITALLFNYCDFAGDLDDLLVSKDSTSQKDQS